MENLWKKEATSSGTMYVDLFACSSNGQCKPFQSYPVEKVSKDNKVSTMFRLQGNDLFQENKVTEAMECYNKSLCFAENGTENVNLAYANRASCFLNLKMYEEALIDIELANQAGYSAQLMPKLKKRQVDCFRLMKTQPERIQFQPKLSFKPNEMFPCMASVLDLRQNEEYGRFVVANGEIDVGQVVLVEQNFASVSIGDGRKTCAKCLKSNVNFIACLKCVDAMYCCSDCMERDTVHRFVCGNFRNVSGSMKLYIQTILIAIDMFQSVDNLMDFIEDTMVNHADDIPESFVDAQSKYRAFLKLHPSLCARDEKDFLFDARKIYMQLILTPVIQELFNSKKKRRFLKHLVLHHLLVTSRNRFQFNSEENLLKITEIAVMACFFNHSCAPNLFHHVIDNQVILIAIRPIRKGEQLFISYLGDKTDDATDFRQQFLMENFEFQCHCDKCEPRCLKVDRALMKSNSHFKYLRQTFKTAFHEQKQRLIFKDVCIRFLQKYGHLPWSEELNFVSLCYINWLFKHMHTDFDF